MVWLMRLVPYGILVFILLTGAVSALDPVNVKITSSTGWMVANGVDSAMVTVHITDGTAEAIKNAEVSLSVTAPWTLEAAGGKTDGEGLFVTRVLPTLKSGTAVITAAVEVKGVTGEPVVRTLFQNITADTPAEQERSYPDSATIGSTTEISVVVTDGHGNPVDSRKKENVVTYITTLSGTRAFVDPKDTTKTKKTVSVPLDDTGTAATGFILDTSPGENYVYIDPPEPLPATLIDIQGVPDGKPASVTLTVIPEGNPPTLTANDASRFVLEYRLEDQYGNPSASQGLIITTTAGESMVATSSSEGRVTVTYGPKKTAGKYTVTATAVKNTVVTVSRVLRFVSDDPVDMLLTASPQSMASREVNSKVVSQVRGKVIDSAGNPVMGEVVSYSILSVDAGPGQTSEPFMESGKTRTDGPGTGITAVSDENGYAIVEFTPGAFTDDPLHPGYSTMAEGIARVRATWSGISREIDLSYKNYPYLSVSATTNPMTVGEGDEVQVSLRLRGDGYLLMPKPIDVLMLNDRSGSMLDDYPDRMVVEMEAAGLFSDQFDYTVDRLGLISFGTNGRASARSDRNCGRDQDSGDDTTYAKKYYGSDGRTYADWAVVDLGLSSDDRAIDRAIAGLVPGGWTPMRSGLYLGITEMKNTARPGAIRALVVMSDGDYNRFGDPLARGSPGVADPNAYGDLDRDYVPFAGLASQSMADYAGENGIRIYTIGYGEDLSSGGKDTLEQLAARTGGRYFYALTGDDLGQVYTQIAEELREAAGVNTRMDLDFRKVEVGGVQVEGAEVLEYVYREGVSTLIMPPPPEQEKTVDSGTEWDRDHRLSFDLGTVKVNDEWVVNFTLKVGKSGNIKILGATSQVTFDDGRNVLAIPDTYLTCIPEGKEGGLGSLSLSITNLAWNPGKNGRDGPLTWDIAYNGNDETIREEIWIAPSNSDSFGFTGVTSAEKDDTSGSYLLDTSNRPPGRYRVRVKGIVGDAGESFDETEISIGIVEQTPQILIR
ncbi:MAG: VWA domain-containing protein [Methanomicrobiales archaeon]|nr:VWA domain-containing protein [Methanomicrobiales archaeon]